MVADHIKALKLSRAKLIETRRSMVKRDSISDRNEGFAERIVCIQAAIDSTDRAIAEEEAMLVSDAGVAA
jgi:hypothetical protein